MREMKDSGVEWIGEIPKDWSTIRLKYLLMNKKNSIKVGPFGRNRHIKSIILSDHLSE